MPLQNRVDPFGRIHAVAARGMFTGNRGVIHDPAGRTLLRRRWTTTAWIVCSCRYKAVRRQPMGRNAPGGGAGWTELFFLDEVTAFAAGHRPCFVCRRAAARAFAGLLAGLSGPSRPQAPEIDARLHRERRASGGKAVRLTGRGLRELAEGAMIAADGVAYAVRGHHAFPWTFEGYEDARHLADLEDAEIELLTPATTLAVLAAGYRPVWHPSAGI